MSDYLVHFTKSGDVSAHDAMFGILATGQVQARNTFGCATGVNGLGVSQQCACFSEIPLDMLDRLVARRSRFGIGFHQLNLIPKGAARVWYLDKDTATRTAMQAKITTAMSGGVDPHDPIWRLTPLVDFAADNYHFEWEREWRIPGGLAFTPTEVAFLFVPEEQHAAARAFLADGGGGTGPAYVCPLLDPLWQDERIQDSLRWFPPPPS